MEGEYLRLDTAKKIAKKGKEIERLNKDLEDLTIEELKKERNNTRQKIIRLNHTNVNNEFIMANVEAQKRNGNIII